MWSTTSALLVLCAVAAYQLQLATSSRVPPQEDEFQCYDAEFPTDHICRTLFPNHTRIMSPNPLQLNERREGFFAHLSSAQYFQKSLESFGEFRPLLTGQDQCSNKIAILLCFSYFPSCMEMGHASHKKYLTFPCRSLCQEVTALGSKCTERISNFNSSWGPFHSCDYSFMGNKGNKTQMYTEEHSQCINQTHGSYYEINKTQHECNKINTTCKYSFSAGY